MDMMGVSAFKKIIIACIHFCVYIHAVESIGIHLLQEPMADESCYNEGDDGWITLSYTARGTSIDRYRIAWNTSPYGDGFWKCNGSDPNFYDDPQAYLNTRFEISQTYINGTIVNYRMDLKDMIYLDRTHAMHPFIIDIGTGEIVNISSVGVQFNVIQNCTKQNEQTTQGDDIIQTTTKTTVPPVLVEVKRNRGHTLGLLIATLVLVIVTLIITFSDIRKKWPNKDRKSFCLFVLLILILLLNFINIFI